MSAESCNSHATDTLKWHWCLNYLHDEHGIAISLRSGVCLLLESLYSTLFPSLLVLWGICACIKIFNVAFSSCLSGLQSLRVVFSQLRICWSLDLAVLSSSAHQNCQRKSCVGQRSLFVQSLVSCRSVAWRVFALKEAAVTSHDLESAVQTFGIFHF